VRNADRLRRAVPVAAAVALVLEALTIAFVNWILGLSVRHQKMSMGGLSSDAMAIGSWAGGGLFALFLVVCAVLAARIAVRDRMAGRAGRIALIVCAVVHGVVGALVIGLVGWSAFAVMMLILALLVGTLLLYAPEDSGAPAGPAPADRPEGPAGAGEAPPAAA
jgi:MFS family permease